MAFESFIEAQQFLLWSAFVLAFIMGVTANKTNFCTMGAVSDWVNMGDTNRFRAWLLAIAVAMLGVAILESMGLVDADGTFPPYRGGELIWVENLLGGLLFGIGMTLASGCGNKTLVRIGAGNIKSIFVLLIIAAIAYFMVNPFPGSDATLMSALFYDWIRPLAINVGQSQDVGQLISSSSEGPGSGRLYAGVVISLLVFAFVFKSADFRKNKDNLFSGIVIGLAVIGGWYISTNTVVEIDEEVHGLQQYVQNWDFIAEDDEGKPADSRPLASQSYTFINPMGQTAGYVANGFASDLLTFGIMGLLGVIAGSLFWALVSRTFRIEWFNSFSDFINHVIGAILMGFGGTLALGCTIGQGITGVSTLAVGSVLTLVAIIFGSALTMKIQYYKLVYEEEASFGSALVASLADMKLLPDGMRKLDKV